MGEGQELLNRLPSTIPPFTDAHVHFSVGGRAASPSEYLEMLNACKRRGIFALNDMGHRTGIGLQVKGAACGEVAVRSAGYALYRKGGYGSFLGKGVEGRIEIVRAIQEIAGCGADFLKVINSGVVSAKGRLRVTEGGFSAGELKVIHDEAAERGMEVVCHANSDLAVRDAVYAGVSYIEHGFFVSRETLDMMAGSATAWTPTCLALLALASLAEPTEKMSLEQVVDGHLSALSYAASIGIKLQAGTDSGSPGVKHGESLLAELRLWKKAGLSTEQILSAACMDEREISKGNYLIVKDDFISSGKIEAVFSNGTKICTMLDIFDRQQAERE